MSYPACFCSFWEIILFPSTKTKLYHLKLIHYFLKSNFSVLILNLCLEIVLLRFPPYHIPLLFLVIPTRRPISHYFPLILPEFLRLPLSPPFLVFPLFEIPLLDQSILSILFNLSINDLLFDFFRDLDQSLENNFKSWHKIG